MCERSLVRPRVQRPPYALINNHRDEFAPRSATIRRALPHGAGIPAGRAQTYSYSVSLRGVAKADIAGVLHERTPGLRSSDIVERAGYPQGRKLVYRARRGTDVIARYEVQPSLQNAVYDSCKRVGWN